jgi:lipopolysaccharide transport system permease protein
MAQTEPNALLPGIAADYEVIVERRRGWLRIDWRELWEYRDLLYILVRRDFLAKYKQTVLGPLWFILQPLLSTMVFTVVFHKVAGIGTEDAPPVLFYLCSLLPWGYFSQNVTTGSGTFTSNAHLFGKVYFPRLVVPLATVISNLFALVLQFAVFLLFFAWFAMHGWPVFLGFKAILVLPLLVVTAAFSLGLSLLVAASTSKYRDLAHLTPIVLQLWLFATPVIYPLSKLTHGDPHWLWLAWANPMAPIVEGFRFALLGHGTWEGPMLIFSAGLTALVLLAGMMVFARAERNAADSV